MCVCAWNAVVWARMRSFVSRLLFIINDCTYQAVAVALPVVVVVVVSHRPPPTFHLLFNNIIERAGLCLRTAIVV